jgi:hypothetical protein
VPGPLARLFHKTYICSLSYHPRSNATPPAYDRCSALGLPVPPPPLEAIRSGPASLRRLSSIRVFLRESIFYGVFVWACRALNSQKRWFSARAGWP